MSELVVAWIGGGLACVGMGIGAVLIAWLLEGRR